MRMSRLRLIGIALLLILLLGLAALYSVLKFGVLPLRNGESSETVWSQQLRQATWVQLR
jgi:hypothetical protein